MSDPELDAGRVHLVTLGSVPLHFAGPLLDGIAGACLEAGYTDVRIGGDLRVTATPPPADQIMWPSG